MGQVLIIRKGKKEESGSQIELTGNMTAGDLIAGKTGYSNDPNNKITGTLELSGNAPEQYVLEGRTFYTTDPKIKQTGIMTSRGAWNGSVTPGGSVTIPAGFHNGSGKVTASGVTVGSKNKQMISQSGNDEYTINYTLPTDVTPIMGHLVLSATGQKYSQTEIKVTMGSTVQSLFKATNHFNMNTNSVVAVDAYFKIPSGTKTVTIGFSTLGGDSNKNTLTGYVETSVWS